MAPPLKGVPSQPPLGPISGYAYHLTGRTWAHAHAPPDWSRLTIEAFDPEPAFIFRPSIRLTPARQGSEVALRCELLLGRKDVRVGRGLETVGETRELVLVLKAAADAGSTAPARPVVTADVDDRSGAHWCRLTADDSVLALSDREGNPRLLVTGVRAGQQRFPIDAQLMLEGKAVFVVRVIDGDGRATAAHVTLQP
jgi:hypothetical protein